MAATAVISNDIATPRAEQISIIISILINTLVNIQIIVYVKEYLIKNLKNSYFSDIIYIESKEKNN